MGKYAIFIVGVLVIAILFVISAVNIHVGWCGEEEVFRKQLGLYACSGWSDESKDNGCRKIGGAYEYFTVSILSEDICSGVLLTELE